MILPFTQLAINEVEVVKQKNLATLICSVTCNLDIMFLFSSKFAAIIALDIYVLVALL